MASSPAFESQAPSSSAVYSTTTSSSTTSTSAESAPSESSSSETDLLVGVEIIEFTDGIVQTAPTTTTEKEFTVANGDVEISSINGTSYVDTITSTSGNDIMIGNGGLDKFVFAAGSGDDRILDFTVTGTDSDGDGTADSFEQIYITKDSSTVGINKTSITTASDVLSRITSSSDGALIDFGSERFPYTDEQLATIDRQWEDFGKHIKYTGDNNFKLYRGSMDMINSKTGETKNRAAHRFIADNTNNWSGWKCYSGVEQIVVDFDGTVMIGWCRVGGSLGNMKDPDNIAWPVDPVICNKSYCHCNFDIMSKKERV